MKTISFTKTEGTRNMRYKSLLLLGAVFFSQVANAADRDNSRWIGTWSAAEWTTKLEQPAGNSTFRNVVHISLGGRAIRVAFTNEFGRTPLMVGAAHVALSAGGGTIQPASDHVLTFGGRTGVMVPSGSSVLSDPVPMPVPDLADLAISVYLPGQDIAVPTCHPLAIATNYIANGDATAQAAFAKSQTYTSNCFVKTVQVLAAENAASIIAFGDSITDGARSVPDTNHRWPDYLAARLHADKHTANLSVLNEGFGGNRILYDGSGASAMARFDRDVLAQPGVKYLVILEGINDIGQMSRPGTPEHELTAEDLIFGFVQMVIRAHQHGIKVYGATLTPNEGVPSATPQGEKVREAYNNWIRTAGVVDGVLDFDKAVQNPASPKQLLQNNDSGDHLHPNDNGYKAMADSIDLKMFY
jgi:lysophospholipase L1-like esterase